MKRKKIALWALSNENVFLLYSIADTQTTTIVLRMSNKGREAISVNFFPSTEVSCAVSALRNRLSEITQQIDQTRQENFEITEQIEKLKADATNLRTKILECKFFCCCFVLFLFLERKDHRAHRSLATFVEKF